VDTNKILKEPCELDNTCDFNSCQFKGIFMRNFYNLYNVKLDEKYKSFIISNVDSIWSKSRDNNNKIGLSWDGPTGGENACTQSSALDALNSAIRINGV